MPCAAACGYDECPISIAMPWYERAVDEFEAVSAVTLVSKKIERQNTRQM
jgi:hypothetical protein